MATNFEDIAQKIADFLKGQARTETVVGQSFQFGEFTCVPVIKFGLGFGYGGGEGKGEREGKGKGEGGGGGAGGGLGVEPIGFLVTRNDQITFLPSRSAKGLGAIFEKIPDLMEKMADRKSKGSRGEEKKS